MHFWSSPSATCFRIWHYSLNDRQLLIRDCRDIDVPGQQNTDLIFSSVFYLDTAHMLLGVTISSPSPEELALIQAKSGVCQDSEHIFFVLTGMVRWNAPETSRGNVIGAGGLEIVTNMLDIYESPLYRPVADSEPDSDGHAAE